MTEVTTPGSLSAELTRFVVVTVDDLVERHLPGLRIPGTFAGHRVEPDSAADLVFTLGHLADVGVTTVAGVGIDEAIATVLARIDGANTHTFFSYRVAETLARYGSFADNRLIGDWSPEDRANLALACDSSEWISLLDAGLPRNYAAVLARCEVARQALGLLDDEGDVVVTDLIARARAVLEANPGHYLDDSTHGVGRYDIYSADVWLFTEPLADRLGPVWAEGLATALDLVDLVGSPDGTAVGWGRSTGVLSGALTVELGALALAGGHSDRPDRWLRRAADATAAMGGWFDGGLITAHQHKSPYDYRGPFRRLQLTLDILGKLAWAAGALGGAAAADGTDVEAAVAAEAYPLHDELARFEAGRAAAVWAHRSPQLEFVVPFVGATRSDYLAAPHRPGLFEVPVDAPLVCWLPTVTAHHHTWVPAGLPVRVDHEPGRVTATWDRLVRRGELDPEPADERPTLAGSCTASWQVEGRGLRVELDLDLEETPEAIGVVIPETARRPLQVEVLDPPAGTYAWPDTIDVDGLKEWRSFWGVLPTVHQIDLDPAPHRHLAVRVTPKLRVGSTAHGHHYDNSLYGPLRDRVRSTAPPIGAFADHRRTLDDIDLYHLHWPEWTAFDDLDGHRHLIEQLSAHDIAIVWTAHNLTPHEKRPEVYDPIYQLWAAAADAVIHHSGWGERVVRERYRFGPDTRHEVLPHGHFGTLHASAAALTRAELDAELGLAPAPLRIGLLGAPRAEKDVATFLAGVAASERDDVSVVCWSLSESGDDRGDEIVPDDPRIAVAEPYAMVDVELYARRLAACDVVALPFRPDGEMLATGVASDVIGMGRAALVSEWPYLDAVLGPAGIPMGHTIASIAAAIDGLTPDRIAEAQAASRARQHDQSWSVVADRTLAVFEDVVATRAARRFA